MPQIPIHIHYYYYKMYMQLKNVCKIFFNFKLKLYNLQNEREQQQ
jgi:hypothetical protein